ncbi:hypothetical protein WJX73_009031 [Symbiochloris irregularis]|uniref:Uncharacterized protein n=1 Tax=Symbiochloris irregularis TaxID=706552 RepID=A0AAW1NH18_9CHLO
MDSAGSIFVNVQPGAMAGKEVLRKALKHVVRPGEEVHIATCAVCHRQNYRKIAAVLQSLQQELASLMALNSAQFHFHVLPINRNACKLTACEQAAESLCTLSESLQCRAFIE